MAALCIKDLRSLVPQVIYAERCDSLLRWITMRLYLLPHWQQKSLIFIEVGSPRLPLRYEDNLRSTKALINGDEQVLVGTFYGVAIITASVRLILQIRFHRRLHVDDYFLIFACITLTAGTILGYANVGALYWTQELNYNPSQFFVFLAQHVDIAAHIDRYERLYYSWPVLLWATIFVVKFAYLAFFRRLIERIRPLFIYWKIIVGITVVSFPICIISVYVACVKHGLEAGKLSGAPLHYEANISI